MSRPRRLARRIVLWMAAALFVLASYILGAPLVWFATWKYAPDLIPVVRFVYTPYGFYCSHPEWPGSQSITEYYAWCDTEVRRRMR